MLLGFATDRLISYTCLASEINLHESAERIDCDQKKVTLSNLNTFNFFSYNS